MALGAILYGSVTAHAEIYSFGFAGPGVSGRVNLTYGTAGDATYPQALKVTGISGSMTDTNNGLSIVNAAITGMVPLALATPAPTNLLAPADFSKFYIASGNANGCYTYDNLFWPGGSVQANSDYDSYGGFLDGDGLLFTIDGGYTVNFWSNGDSRKRRGLRPRCRYRGIAIRLSYQRCLCPCSRDRPQFLRQCLRPADGLARLGGAACSSEDLGS